MALAETDASLLQRIGSTDTIAAEIVYAVREEMALTLTDVVTRRTGLGTAGHPGRECARCAAAVMQRELGWDGARVSEELEALERFYAPVAAPSDS